MNRQGRMHDELLPKLHQGHAFAAIKKSTGYIIFRLAGYRYEVSVVGAENLHELQQGLLWGVLRRILG